MSVSPLLEEVEGYHLISSVVDRWYPHIQSCKSILYPSPPTLPLPLPSKHHDDQHLSPQSYWPLSHAWGTPCGLTKSYSQISASELFSPLLFCFCRNYKRFELTEIVTPSSPFVITLISLYLICKSKFSIRVLPNPSRNDTMPSDDLIFPC